MITTEKNKELIPLSTKHWHLAIVDIQKDSAQFHLVIDNEKVGVVNMTSISQLDFDKEITNKYDIDLGWLDLSHNISERISNYRLSNFERFDRIRHPNGFATFIRKSRLDADEVDMVLFEGKDKAEFVKAAQCYPI